MTKESQMSGEQMTKEALKNAAKILQGCYGIIEGDFRFDIFKAKNACLAALAAQSAAPVGEPVAWTNEAQLGYLRDRNWSEVPMAMWSKPIGAADIPLYRAALAKPGDS